MISHFCVQIADFVPPPPPTESTISGKVSRGMSAAGQKRFFGVPLTAGSWCELDTSTLGPGVALTVSQATLAEPLPSGTCTHSVNARACTPLYLPTCCVHRWQRPPRCS